MQLIIFYEFLQKLDRILSHGGGAPHNLVIGSSGCERRTMAELLCYTLRIECRILRVFQHYRGGGAFESHRRINDAEINTFIAEIDYEELGVALNFMRPKPRLRASKTPTGRKWTASRL